MLNTKDFTTLYISSTAEMYVSLITIIQTAENPSRISELEMDSRCADTDLLVECYEDYLQVQYETLDAYLYDRLESPEEIMNKVDSL